MMAITVSGARRLTTSEQQTSACRPSKLQASGPGRAGHQVAPSSVAAVSSSAKKTAIATSIANQCRWYNIRQLTWLRLRRERDTWRSQYGGQHLRPARNLRKSHGGPRDQPFGAR